MMNGNFRVESELGKGSTFIFSIRAETGPAETDSPEPGCAELCYAQPGSHAPAENGKNEKSRNDEPPDMKDRFAGRRVLLAEDVDINREIVKTVLEPTAILIDEAENGYTAFQKYAAAPGEYDMILMDIQMPGMGGYEAARLIRAMDIESAKLVPIIAMTANVFKEDIEQCLKAGMNDHIGKPLDFDELLHKMSRYLRT
jgi:CheY-like chemotaxis protein